MRVLFLLTYYTPHWTGLTQYAKRLAKGLSQKGHEVTVLTTKHEPNLKNREVINGVNVERKDVLFRLSRTLISPSFVWSFWQEIRKSEIIVIYLPFAEVLVATFIAKVFGKKVFLVHNGDLKLPEGFLNRIIEFFYNTTTSLSIRLSNAIIVQTQDYANNSVLLTKFKNKQVVILPLFPLPHVDLRIQKELQKKIGNKGSVIGFAGRFVEEKGFDILFTAMPKVVKKIPGVKFVFAGETKMSYEDFFEKNKEMIERNRKNVVFLGKLKQEEMFCFYKLCDVFVISSRSDCFPSAQVEALLCNTPVVVTDIPGARVPVSKTGMGMIVEKEDPDSLAKGIVNVYTKRDILKKKQEKVLALFNWDKTLVQYEKVFGDF